jgi:carnosine N-methyltransferase
MEEHSHNHDHSGHHHGNEGGDGHGHEELSPADADAAHFQDVVASFQVYERHSMAIHGRLLRDFAVLSSKHKALLKNYTAKLASMRQGIQANARFLGEIIGDVDLFGNGTRTGGEDGESASAESIDKVHGTLRQFVRDWGVEGASERERSYAPLLREAEKLKPLRKEAGEVNKYRVLVPGCGLGRLVWEFAHRGYAVQGNEFSYHMLLGSNWVLNQSGGIGVVGLYPYAVSGCNRLKIADQFARVEIPDVATGDLPDGVDMSMNAGEFVEIYGGADFIDAFDVIAAPFFLDTAHNAIEYLETIWHCLKPGGVWIHMGPLLWHYVDQQDERQVELSLQEVVQVARELGFKLEMRDPIVASYSADKTSMMQTVYTCAFFVATKPE